MCFSEKWSRTISILGVGLTSYRILNNYNIVGVLVPLFYTVMEITQYYQYTVINQCNNSLNINLTKFTWVLEWIQPFMWNAIFFYWTKKNKEVFKFTMVLSLIVFVCAMFRVFNNSTNKSITHELQVKGRNCSIKGKKHIIWNNNAQTFYGLEPNWFVYIMLWFLPMLWITPLRTGIGTFIFQFMGIILTFMILGKKINDEFASTWCLISIPGIILSEIIGRGRGRW